MRVKMLWIGFALLVSWSAGVVSAESGTAPVKPAMAQVYHGFVKLEGFVRDEGRFFAPEYEDAIYELVKHLSREFHRVDELSEEFVSEPGFVETLAEVRDTLSDAAHRFKEGKKEYARWRLAHVTDYCMMCHTRLSVPSEFGGGEPEGSANLSSFARGQFYLATRQFSKAQPEFLAAVKDPTQASDRMDALRRWLLIQVRVSPSPQPTMKTLESLKSSVAFGSAEMEEIQGWLVSLRRWQNERKSDIDPVTRAAVLISQGINLNDPPSSNRGTVEFLRATALLHGVLAGDSAKKTKERRARVLYLLGRSYVELKPLFVEELPERFLESCIRELPGSADAKRAFSLYREIVEEGFTGSGGTRVPDEVQLQIDELGRIAHGLPLSSPSL